VLTIRAVVSIEKPLFERIERMARKRGVSRSSIVNEALRQFFSRYDDRDPIARINAASEEPPDPRR